MTDRGLPPGAAPGTTKTASEVLRDIEAAATRASGERIAIDVLLQGVGSRLYGLALIAFALPEAIPFPAVGLTGVVAIPLAVLSLSMLAMGMQHQLPGWIRRREIKRSWAIAIARRGGGLIHRLERLSYPRMTGWTELGRPIGLLCLALSLVMAIPVPFSNVAPGVTVVALGVGVVQRDGLLVLLAMGVGILILTLAAVLLTLGWQAFF